MTLPLLFGFLWALLLLGVYLRLPRLLSQREISAKYAWLIVGAIALIARLVPNLVLPMGAGYDIESYQIVGGLVLRGEDVYASPDAVNRHPYLPFQMYWMAFAHWAASAMHLPFVKVVRLAPILADVGIALLLFLYLQRGGPPKKALHGGLLYALNPVPVLVSAYHGQFDAIPALFLLLAVMALEKWPLLAGGWLGLGILSKSWPVLVLPSLCVAAKKWEGRLRFLVGVAFVPMVGMGIYLLLFRAQLWAVLGRALGYNHGVGIWGYTYFFQLFSVLEPGWAEPFAWLVHYGRYITLGALGLVWLLKARKESPRASVLTILVAFFAVTHALAIQYVMWVVPFAILNRDDKWLNRYTLGALIYMLLTYMTLILSTSITRWLPWAEANTYIIRPSTLPAWLLTVAWLIQRLRTKPEIITNAG